ncbi:hypothetical protein [Paraburkholderia fungorum]|uniref:hypothetical protein n=1 Tax=Paraburkholderia fungorum TaxID=134537 RepID=UPI0038B773B7
MDIQQKINLALMTEFAEAGVEFAFPTQTLHVASAPQEFFRAAGQPAAHRVAFQN